MRKIHFNPASLAKRPEMRSLLLFLDFFLIILAYYQVKPASRSLFLEYSDAEHLPYLWTASAVLLLILMPLYEKLLKNHTRLNIVLGTCGVVMVLLLVFRVLLMWPNLWTAIGFYLLVDIFSVILIEQFWSLTNSVFGRQESKRWYGLIASGGLVGGLAGGYLANFLISRGSIDTFDLTVVAAGIIAVMMWLTTRLAHHGMYDETPEHPHAKVAVREAWSALRGNRYLTLIAVMLLLSQMAEPIIEYQFMHLVQQTYTEREARTAYISGFFSLLNGVALTINLLLTPFLLRKIGPIGGLMVQPLLLGFAAIATAFQYRLVMVGMMKIFDRGLSYSINRTARELVYVRADTETLYRAKAWIDMVGYRTFKIAGNATILLLTQWLPWVISDATLTWVVVALCGAWLYTAIQLGRRSKRATEPQGDAHLKESALVDDV